MPRTPLVLVVDDTPQIRKLMRLHLEQAGLSVVEAGDGNEAISQLERAHPDLVCLDLMLPSCSGYQVCEYMRQRDQLRDIPVLVVSARSQPVDRAHAEDVGASAYLVKPFSRAAFLEQVHALLRQPAAAAKS